MRVVCLVPSLTETLIECGVNVVGRTRFCVHPEAQVQKSSVVGGTKDLNWDKFKALQPDLLILDQEENLAWMKEQSPVPVHVTHVTSIQSLPGQIRQLSEALNEPNLLSIAQRWQEISGRQAKWDWSRIPGQLDRLGTVPAGVERLVYVIWKNPWMTVSKETFIGSVLAQLGAGSWLPEFGKKYPSFEMEDFDPQKTFFLFSSEPFPFHKKIDELRQMGLQGSIVDGEAYSWFGIRSLKFLENEITGR
jgi:ABC-type Fe3+-hydroxamate transport system substrate-binding protein